MNKLFQKVLSVAVAAAVLVSSASVPAKAASSAKVKFYTYCFSSDSKWIAGDGADSTKVVSSTKTVKKGKAVSVTLTIKGNCSKGIGVLTVDSGNSKKSNIGAGVLKTFKTAKYSNVSVKCDGKTVKAPYQQGYFEKDTNTQSWRLSFYNQYGNNGDTTKTKCKANAKNIKFKKTCQISFTFTAK